MNDFFLLAEDKTKFPCELATSGGYIDFKNSGQRGAVKQFTLSLKSIISGLKDILENYDSFAELNTYREKEWRDAGSNFFQDLVLNSMITVQTKPCFVTLSKVISWANSVDPSNHDDNSILLTRNSLEKTITKLTNLSSEYTPNITKSANKNSALISSAVISSFAYEVIKYLVINHRDEVLSHTKINTKNSKKIDLPHLSNG